MSEYNTSELANKMIDETTALQDKGKREKEEMEKLWKSIHEKYHDDDPLDALLELKINAEENDNQWELEKLIIIRKYIDKYYQFCMTLSEIEYNKSCGLNVDADTVIKMLIKDFKSYDAK